MAVDLAWILYSNWKEVCALMEGIVNSYSEQKVLVLSHRTMAERYPFTDRPFRWMATKRSMREIE